MTPHQIREWQEAHLHTLCACCQQTQRRRHRSDWHLLRVALWCVAGEAALVVLVWLAVR
jgi:hypothetical protein